MEYTYSAYIKLISSYVTKDYNYDIDFKRVSKEKLTQLALQQKNIGQMYAACSKINGIPSDITSYFQKGMLTQVAKNSIVQSLQLLICKELKKEKIPFVILKGTTIARYYYEPELRNLGDIDLLIDKKYAEDVHKIMINLDMEHIYEQSDESLNKYKNSRISVEVHFGIAIGETLGGRYDYQEYFSNYLEHVEPYENGAFCLELEYNIIYMIYHMAKHFYYSGCGVRMINDFAFVVKSNWESIEWTYITEQLEYIKLKEFANIIFAVSNLWFDTKIDNNPVDKKVLDSVCEYIISGGSFGFKNISSDNINMNSVKGNRFVSLITWAFPSNKKMRQHSEWYKNKPVILLPIAYIERIMRNAKERGGLIKWVKKLSGSKEEIAHHNTMIKKIGL